MNTLPILIAISLSSFFGGLDEESTTAGPAPIEITVKPAAPKQQTFHLAENSGKNARVGTISIPDSPGTKGLKFKITAGNEGSAFSIDSHTGELTVANSRVLDFEKHASFDLTVQVTGSQDPLRQSFAEHLLDSGIDWKSASGILGPQKFRVVIRLDNVNEAPQLRTGVLNVAKNTDFTKTIGRVKGLDPDKGDRLTYSITAGNTAETFVIGTHSGKIGVKNLQAMSPGNRSRYSLTVQAKDNGGLIATTTVIINVAWLNHAPTLTAGTFRFGEKNSESEIKSGMVVGRMTASDSDPRDRHIYRITAGNSRGAFAIGAGTGEITVADAGMLVSEDGSPFKLTVQVKDLEGATAEAFATIEFDRVDESALTDATPVPVETGGTDEIAGNDSDPAAVVSDSDTNTDTDTDTDAAAEAGIDDGNASIPTRPNYGTYTVALGLICGLVYLMYMVRVSRSRWKSARKKEEVAKQLKKRMAGIGGSEDLCEEAPEESEEAEDVVDLSAFRAATAERARTAKHETLQEAGVSSSNAEIQNSKRQTEHVSVLDVADAKSSEKLKTNELAMSSQVAGAIDEKAGSFGKDAKGDGDGWENTTGDDVISRELMEDDAPQIDASHIDQTQSTDSMNATADNQSAPHAGAESGEVSDADAMAEYMERLLAEARGDTYQPGARTNISSVAAVNSSGSSDDSSLKPETSVATPAEVEAKAKPRTSTPRPSQDKNAIRAELDSMREVANLSARTAIAWHDVNKQRRHMWVPCLLGIVSFGVSGALLTGAAGTTPTIPGGCAAAIVGGMMILKMIHGVWSAGRIERISNKRQTPRPE